ncbi:hypothetical protein FQN54_003241 [Arachnomyces sp. PD_36]|nr:hypothetical protein FQN54_003241 [Arachnomyces sp. PD_36]
MEVSPRRDGQSSSPLSEPEDNASSPAAENRRKSGRATRKPELFSQVSADNNNTANSGRSKRKRAAGQDADNEDEDENEDEVDEDEEDASDSDESDGEADEEELKEKRKKSRRTSSQKKKKPNAKPKAKPAGSRAAKKPKMTNGFGTELAIRPAVNGKKTASKSKKARARPGQIVVQEDGLFAEVFSRGHTTEAAAAEWLMQYERDNINAMCDLINFVLRCTGTDLKIEGADIHDVDNVASKINDLQEEYQEQGMTEYPLISRARQYRSFQSILEGFFEALVSTIHSSSVLYNEPALIENIQIWITSMSSAPIRPFRHTATIISLTITTTLCNVATEVTSGVSNSRKQLEGEKKKKTVNKGRMGAMQTKVQEGEKRLETIDEVLRDSFDTVFVHRYRDVDPKIRAECMLALGRWITTYREMFFEGQYLRYLGWVLSDTVAHTRAVVVAQLHKLFENKDNIVGLRAFTDRFRPRIVEMATRDAEPSVRAATVELLDLVRDAELLEPEDIDTVGRLVFDTEPRVRKAAGGFFVANIQDVYESATESLGEDWTDTFLEEDEANFIAPRSSWIKFKCLVDVLQAYDDQETEIRSEQPPQASREAFISADLDSRFVRATESIYPHLEELEQWEALAGYLLHDHSQIEESPAQDDTGGLVKNMYKLNEGQEVILLEVLGSAVKLRILQVARSETDRRGKKTKATVEQAQEEQEEIAHTLAQIIPQLLNKFGALPEAASVVLRLEHLVNLEMIQDLQKDVTIYSDLLGDINKQFLTHSHQEVLAEATVAFLHARTSDELKEAMESKIQELWDDTLDTLRNLSQDKAIEGGTAMSVNVLTELSNTVMRISNLASIADCTSILDAVPTASKKQKSRAEAPVDILLKVVKRGLRDNEESDEETDMLERELVISGFRVLLFYFMWKVQLLTSSPTGPSSFDSSDFDSLTSRRDDFVSTLTSIMQHRSGLDDIRFASTITLLDLQTVFGTLRHVGSPAPNVANGEDEDNDDEPAEQARALVQEISPDTHILISRIHDSAERAFAKKSRRTLDIAEDADVLDSESELSEPPSDDDEAMDDEDLNGNTAAAKRARATLLAEQKLCELTGKIVLAIIGRVLDASGPQRGKLRQKLARNKTRLGPSYKEVISYLDSRKEGGGRKRPAAKKDVATNNTGKEKSTVRVQDSDDEDNDDHNEDNEREEDDDEDLRARELVEEGNNNGDDGNDDDDAVAREGTAAANESEDEVMGD